MKKILVLTSGGDAPGMNAAIRGIIREASFNDVQVYAAHDGFQGLVEGHILPLTNHDIAGTLQHGGTILGTARYPQFREKPYVMKACQNLRQRDIDGVIVIGGNGSLNGAHALHLEGQIPVIGIPASIDNDLSGTDMAIGVDTALNTIVYNVDKIRDTASSHSRLFVIEVMGRDCGYLALNSAISCGALAVLIPELQESFDPDVFGNLIYKAFRRSKKHAIVIKAEGFTCYSDAQLKTSLSAYMAERGVDKLSMRFTNLGHIQRGGAPTSFDRLLASKMGLHAVRQLLAGNTDVMMGLVRNTITTCPLTEVGLGKRDRVLALYDEYMLQEILMSTKLTPKS
ncbi:MAG: ATP-dependent 6-phosphofructokinase [Candidatus Sericytochromatia bacterium]